MQNARQPTQPERALYYWAKMYLSGLQRGQGYEDLRPCIGIWLLGYRQLPGERSHTILKLRDIDGHADFSEHLELHTVELPKLPKCEGQWPRGSLEAWGRFLGARGLSVTEEQKARIVACKDLDLLRKWHRRAVTAASTDEVFAD